MKTAHLSLESLSPYTQSRLHGEPRLSEERGSAGHDAYDQRTWRSHLHVRDGQIIIPAAALKFSLVGGAKYSKERVPGGGQTTWGSRFTAGIGIFEDIPLGKSPDEAQMISILAHANGKRMPGPRVLRRFPQIAQWQASATVTVLDDSIDLDLLRRMTDFAGLFVGVGQYRPENGGTCGRYRVVGADWV